MPKEMALQIVAHVKTLHTTDRVVIMLFAFQVEP